MTLSLQDLENPAVMKKTFHSLVVTEEKGKIQRLHIQQQKAFSNPKRKLRRYTLTIQYGRKKETVHVRGRMGDPVFFTLLQDIYTPLQKANVLSAQPLLFIPSLSYLLYREVEGKPLRQLEKQSHFWKEYSGKVGNALAALQTLNPKSLQKRTLSDEHAFLRDRKHILASGTYPEPQWVARVNALIKQSSQIVSRRQMVFSHGDFQASNILFDQKKKRVGIIDIDHAERFHPAADVATFFVHSSVMLQYHFSPKTVDGWMKHFLKIYMQSCSSQKKKIIQKDFAYFYEKTRIDIAATTVQSFRTPTIDRKKVFSILNNIQSPFV